MEYVYLGLAVVAIIALLWVLRRASDSSKANTAASVRERIGLEEAEGAPRRKRRREIEAEQQRAAEEAQRREEEARAKKAKPKKKEVEEEEEEVEAAKPEAEEAAEEAADAEAKAAFKEGLTKTRGGFVARLGKLFGRKKFDPAQLDQLEEVLISADIGPRTADRIFQAVKKGLSKNELESSDQIWKQIRKTSREILAVETPPLALDKKPFVLLVLGVNGAGKTTTIGKLAKKWTDEGKKVLLAAGDTFRAAATEQLEVWGDRAKVPVVKGKPKGDPSSVVFEAVKRGVDEGFDVVICDTAGRLQTDQGLMDELKKIRRVCDKALPGAPHETWMVLDATTGQNAISQANKFKADLEVTGIILTKLDGSSKGGVVLGICDQLKLPVRFVGVGEKIGDLRPFDSAAFLEALYADASVGEAA
ncbi:MAG: signal recognition particle-docking protein FtsY [Deltaproteobacteria bacterium]|nr:signal recognition particle-docking protein FtsY [Deltaproteobacteria bacterium]